MLSTGEEMSRVQSKLEVKEQQGAAMLEDLGGEVPEETAEWIQERMSSMQAALNKSSGDADALQAEVSKRSRTLEAARESYRQLPLRPLPPRPPGKSPRAVEGPLVHSPLSALPHRLSPSAGWKSSPTGVSRPRQRCTRPASSGGMASSESLLAGSG